MISRKWTIVTTTIMIVCFVFVIYSIKQNSDEAIKIAQEKQIEIKSQPAWREIDRMKDDSGNLIVTYKRNGYVGTSWDMMIFYNKDGSLFKTVMRNANNN